VDNKEGSEEITWKISAAPNPTSLGEGCAVISWEPTIPAEEIRVAASAGEESWLLEEENLRALKFIGLWTQMNASFPFTRRAAPTNRLSQ
jgi:hypothetical protein